MQKIRPTNVNIVDNFSGKRNNNKSDIPIFLICQIEIYF